MVREPERGRNELNRAYRIGKIAGIEVRVHSTFPLFILALGVLEGIAGGWLQGLRVMGILSTLFAFVLLHELGHSLVAQRFGVSVLSITLLPIGGLAATGSLPRRPYQEILIALAGPAVNIVLALLLGIVLFVTEMPFDLDGPGLGPFLSYLLGANVMLALFNLVPAFPLDGGRVLRALLATRLAYPVATRRAVLVGKVFSAVFFLLGLWKPGLFMLSLIAVFLFFSGHRELKAVEFEDFLRQRRAGDFLSGEPFFLGRRDTRFAEVCEAFADNEELRHCVLDLEGLRYGVLTRRQLMSACMVMPAALEVHRIVEERLVALPVELPILQALPLLHRAPRGLLPVRDGLRIVGVLSLEELMALLRGRGQGL